MAELAQEIPEEEYSIPFTASTPDSPDTISFKPSGTTPRPTPAISDVRALKIHYGLGDKSPGYDVIRPFVIDGNEKPLRDKVAYEEAIEWGNQRNALIQDIAKKQGGNLTPQALSILQTMTKQDFSKDPQTIFEKKFAEKYMNNVIYNGASEKPTGIYSRANPKYLLENAAIAEKIEGDNAAYQRLYEDTTLEERGQSTLGKIGDFVFGVIPFVPWWVMTNRTKGAPTTAFSLLGGTIKEQVQYIRSLPIEQGLPLAQQTINEIKKSSMQMAAHFAQALVSYGTSDQYLDSSISIADLSTFPGIRASRMVGRAIRGPGELPAPQIQTLLPWNEVQQAGARARQGEDLRATFGAPPLMPKLGLGPIEDLPSIEAARGSTRIPGTFGDIKEAVSRSAAAAETYPSPITGMPTRARPDLEIPRTVAPEGAPITDLPSMGAIRGATSVTPSLEDLRSVRPEAVAERTPARQLGDLMVAAERRKMAAELPAEELQSMADIRGALKDAVKATAENGNDLAGVLAQTGDAKRASLIGGYQRVNALLNPQEEGTITLEKDLMSFMNPLNIFAQGSSLAEQRAMKIVDRMQARLEQILQAWTGSVRGARLPEKALIEGIKESEERLMNTYMWKINDGFLDIVFIPREGNVHGIGRNPANVDTVVMRIGKPGDASPFASRAEADTYARDIYNLQPGEYQTYRQGDSFYVGVSTHIDERSDRVLNAIYAPEKATPTGFWNTMLGRVRSNEDLLSETHREQLRIATHAPQTTRAVMREQSEAISRGLRKNERKELERVLEVGQDKPWIQTAADFEREFQIIHKKNPTDKQIEGYFVYKSLADFDFFMENMHVYKEKAKNGFEQFSIRMGGEDLPYFEGRQVDNVDWKRTQNAGILVHTAGDPNPRYILKSDAAGKNPAPIKRNDIQKLVDEGYKVIQIADSKLLPLKGITNEEINFVVTNDLRRKNLSWHQVEYSPGVHVTRPYPWNISQAIITTGPGGGKYYRGDNAVLNFQTEAEAGKYVARMNTAREMLKANSANLDDYLSSNLPYTREQFTNLFSTGKLDINEPLVKVRINQHVLSSEELARKHPNVIHRVNDPYDLTSKLDPSVNAHKSNILSTIQEEGGVFRLSPNKELSPYSALQTSLSQRIRTTWLNDYKDYAVRSWTEEFSDVLVPNQNQLRANPYGALYNPQFRSGGGTEEFTNRLAAAKATQRAIINFIGQNTELGDAVGAFQNKIMNTIYQKLGQKASGYVADHYLPFINDPAAYLRAVAFHTKLGMLNPTQLLLQANSLTHVMAVAGPTHAVPGTAAAFMMRYLTNASNDAIATEAGKRLRVFGWKPEEFTEMYNAFKSTGIYHVMGEAAMRHDLFDNQIFKSTIGHYLDKGAWFFNEGERIVRLSAFATAYREWKAVNKAVAIGDNEIATIMNRADLLSLNMTKASLASYQKGLLSIPTQFMTFPIRLAEQLIGKRLTTAEKARVCLTYAAMYGIPTGLGIGGIGGAVIGGITGTVKGGVTEGATQAAAGFFGQWPVYEDIRAEALKRNIDLSPAYMQALVDGVPSMLLAQITGKPYNLSQVYGPGGNKIVRDILREDKGILDVLGGASASIIGDILGSTSPLLRQVTGIVYGGNNGYELTQKDFERVLRTISSADLAVKVWGIANLGEIRTKTNQVINIKPMDTMDTVMATMNLTPQSVADTFTKMSSSKDTRNAQKYYEDKAIEEYRLGLQYSTQKDYKQSEVHMRNAQAYMELGKFTPMQQPAILKRALQTLEPLEARIDQSFIRRPPADQYIDRLKAFQKKMEQ